jgi:hypothetical protein
VRSADVVRVARSHPTPPLVAHSVRAICATAGSRAGTPSTMIAARKLIDREPIQSLRTSPEILMTPDKAGGSTDFYLSTTGGRAQ